MAGIAAVAFYFPRHVITSDEYRRGAGQFDAQGIDEKRVPGFDEDAITMAVAAGERCLAAIGPMSVDILAYATAGTLSGGAIVADALGIDAAKARDVRGSRDAGETALAGAVDGATKDGTTHLVIATDAPRGEAPSPEENAFGAAAAAILVTPKGRVSWKRGSVPSQSVIRHLVGDIGAVSVLLSFLTSVESSDVAGDLDLAGALKSRAPVTYDQYVAMCRRGAPAGTEFSQGAYVSLAAYLAEKKARYRLIGERCMACGRLHFPPREACLACGARSWEDVPLKRTGTVYAYTIIGKGAAPSEFLEQQLAVGEYATAVVELDEGPRIAAMLTDVDPTTVRVGMPVRMVFRRIYTQEGVPRYGFKFARASAVG